MAEFIKMLLPKEGYNNDIYGKKYMNTPVMDSANKWLDNFDEIREDPMSQYGFNNPVEETMAKFKYEGVNLPKEIANFPQVMKRPYNDEGRKAELSKLMEMIQLDNGREGYRTPEQQQQIDELNQLQQIQKQYEPFDKGTDVTFRSGYPGEFGKSLYGWYNSADKMLQVNEPKLSDTVYLSQLKSPNPIDTAAHEYGHYVAEYDPDKIYNLGTHEGYSPKGNPEENIIFGKHPIDQAVKAYITTEANNNNSLPFEFANDMGSRGLEKLLKGNISVPFRRSPEGIRAEAINNIKNLANKNWQRDDKTLYNLGENLAIARYMDKFMRNPITPTEAIVPSKDLAKK